MYTCKDVEELLQVRGGGTFHGAYTWLMNHGGYTKATFVGL